MSKKVTTEDFIKEAVKVHGNRYDYSKAVYTKAKDKLCIICKEHGEFWQAPDKHLRGQGCTLCSRPNSNLTNEEFIKRAAEKHNNKYDYSKTQYIGYNKKVTIICPEHGEFQVVAGSHLLGTGCAICGGSKRYDTERFVKKHRSIFGNQFDYSKTDLENRENNKVCIVCPDHGPYYKTPTGHLKSGCPTCSSSFGELFKTVKKTSNTKGLNVDDFITLARQIHGDKYTYDKSVYKGIYTPIIVTCPIHGDITVSPNNFLRGHGCKRCACSEQARIQIELAAAEFQAKARERHGDKYSYDKVVYKNAHDKVCITCPTHGDFWQSPNSHLGGCECPKCSARSWAYTTEEFIEQAKAIHGDLYDYSKTVYVNRKTDIVIVCPEHGEVFINAGTHLSGGKCPICVASKIESSQERDVRAFLERHNIEYQREKKFSWLKRGRTMLLDFYLPKYNVAIECQGYQHFKPHVFFGGEAEFKNILLRDQMKKTLCETHGIRLLYYSNLGFDYPYEIYEDFESLYYGIINNTKLDAKSLQYTIDFKD